MKINIIIDDYRKLILILMLGIVSITFGQNITLDINYSPSNNHTADLIQEYSDNLYLFHTELYQSPKIRLIDSDGTAFQSLIWSGNGTINAIDVQSDGKIIIGGSFTNINGVNVYRIARLNTNGTIDMSFNPPILGGPVKSLVVLMDDRILVSGSSGNSSLGNLFLLDSDGFASNNSFNQNLGDINGLAYVIKVLDDGKILLAGNFSYYSTEDGNSFGTKILKLNDDGTRDISFSSIGGNVSNIDTIGISQNYFYAYLGYGKIKKYSLNTGNTISSFQSVSGFDDAFRVFDIKVQYDGKVIVGGYFNGYDNYSNVKNIMRLNTNGTIDYNFLTQVGRIGVLGGVVHTLLIDEGSLYVFGSFEDVNSDITFNSAVKFIDNSFLNINKNNFDIGLSIYPNPSNGLTNINFGRLLPNIQLEVKDVLGKTVYRHNYLNTQHIELNTSSYSKGMYFINVKHENEIAVLKLIVN